MAARTTRSTHRRRGAPVGRDLPATRIRPLGAAPPALARQMGRPPGPPVPHRRARLLGRVCVAVALVAGAYLAGVVLLAAAALTWTTWVPPVAVVFAAWTGWWATRNHRHL